MRSSATPPKYWLTLVLASTAFIQAPAATATTAVVPDDYPTLQSAMDAAWGPAFDTLFVRPGVAADSLCDVNLRGISVIGFGDSVSRPVIGNTVFNSPYACTVKNLRFAGGARTVGHAYLDFIDCELDGGL